MTPVQFLEQQMKARRIVYKEDQDIIDQAKEMEKGSKITLSEKHTIEMALRNAQNLLYSYNMIMVTNGVGISEDKNILTNSFNNALDTLSRIEITEPKQHIEEVIDLTEEIKNNSNLEFKEDELYLTDVQK